jgi:hypothetical protein
MKRDGNETVASNGEEALAAQWHLPSTRPSAASLGRASTHDRLSTPELEALLRQVREGNQQAWAVVEQCLGESVRGWLRGHPGKETACRWEREEDFVSLALERFRQALTAGRLQASTSLPTALRYLQVCLYGVLLDSLRGKELPEGIPFQEYAHSGEQSGEDHLSDRQAWKRIQKLFPDVHEQRVAYLLFHCGLQPKEIVRLCPQEWSNVQELAALRRTIMDRILRHADQLGWPLG